MYLPFRFPSIRDARSFPALDRFPFRAGLTILVLILAARPPGAFAEELDAITPYTGPTLDSCPPERELLLGDDRPGLVCCPDQPYVLCSQSSCKLLAGVAICDCIYMGRGVSLA